MGTHVAQKRAHFTISEVNYSWLQQHAPNEKGMSRLIDDLLQQARTIGPITAQLQRQADRLDRIIDAKVGSGA
jgi:hypothetical protein